MFNKLLSGLGVQSVKADTVLFVSSAEPGQMINGEIRFQGIDRDKQINGISLQLMTVAEVEYNDSEFTESLCIASWQVSGAFKLPAKQLYHLPFSIQLPFETPITEVPCHRNSTRVWLKTHLDVDWGLDAEDRDYLRITPTATMTAFLTAMQQCGFNLVTVDVEKGRLHSQYFQSTIGCYQEFEFVPAQFFSGINEVEVSFVAEAHQTHVMFEIDRKFRLNDQYLTLTLPHQQVNVATLVQQIKQVLNLD